MSFLTSQSGRSCFNVQVHCIVPLVIFPLFVLLTCLHDKLVAGPKKIIIMLIIIASLISILTEAECPKWSDLEQVMTAVHSVVHGLVKFSKVSSSRVQNSSLLSAFW